MALYTIDPLSDKRWDEFIATHPKSSVFHQTGWLRALTATYEYQPMAVTNAAAGEPLREAILFCMVESWITGTRLVSLPFADHCEPLLSDSGGWSEFVEWMQLECDKRRWKYVELRPVCWNMASDSSLKAGSSYWLHTLDLTAPIEEVFRRLHKDSLQRRIQRAERERLTYERGRSEQLLDDFYRLLLMTRRRHRWLPQPRTWFHNLAENLGENLQIRIARKNGIAIAALLTLRSRNTAVYKYGCSDEKFHPMAGIPFLFWKLIEESKAEGAEQLDFGRTDLGHDSLVRFKDQFGTHRQQITYFRYPATRRTKSATSWSGLRRICSVLPNAVLPLAGRLVYRHIG